MWRMLFRNIARNYLRSFLTGSSVAISLFMITSLSMVYQAMGTPYQGADTTPRMMVRRLSGLVFPLPRSYGDRIRAVPGVAAVTSMSWFGGYWVDRKNQFANFAMDASTVFDVLQVARISPSQLQDFKSERSAAVAGNQLIQKFHWKIGDRITLLGSPYGITPTLTLRGVFTGGPDDQFYFHYSYLNEALGGRFNQVGLYWIRIDRPDRAAQVARAIDTMFRDSPAETKTESENNFLLNFVGMLGNVRAIILMIGSAVAFAILLIVANTMAMSTRERIPEAAIMRVIGFRSKQIMALFVTESLVITAGGGALGIVFAKLLFDAMRISKIGPMVWVDLRVRPEALIFTLLLSLLIALAASLWPAYRASRINLAQALRFAG